MSHLRAIQTLKQKDPHKPFATLLQSYAFQCFLRSGRVPSVVNTLLSLSERAERKKSLALVDQQNSRPWILKYSPDQPRVPAGNPDGGQWTSIEGDEWPHQVNNRENQKIRLAADISGFTKHGLNQAINRDISPSAILDAINNPIKIIPKSNGTTRYIGRRAVVVLIPAGTVVTVWGQ